MFWGIIAALVLRGLAILGGTTLIEQFHFVLYVLGVLLLVLAYRIYKGVGEDVDPDRNLVVRGVRRVFPVTDGFRNGHWFVREDGRRPRHADLPLPGGIVAADIAFAVDSIPAAFAITREPLIILAGNVFALFGLRALFVLVEGLIRRFRYLDETIAVVLALVAVKLLIEPLGEDRADREPRDGRVRVRDRHRRIAVVDRRDPEGAAERRAGAEDERKPTTCSRPPAAMRPSLLEHLRCPSCRAERSLVLTARARDERELREGELDCSHCHGTFAIADGIVDLLFDAPESVAREAAGLDRFADVMRADGWDRERILALPDVPLAYWAAQRQAIDSLLDDGRLPARASGCSMSARTPAGRATSSPGRDSTSSRWTSRPPRCRACGPPTLPRGRRGALRAAAVGHVRARDRERAPRLRVLLRGPAPQLRARTSSARCASATAC